MWIEATAIYADCLITPGLIGKEYFNHHARETKNANDVIARSCFNSTLSCNWVDDTPSFLIANPHLRNY